MSLASRSVLTVVAPVLKELPQAVREPVQPHFPQSDIRVEVSALPHLEVLEPLWRGVESRADGSFFTTWSWIGPWLAGLGLAGDSGAVLMTAYGAGQVVGLAVWCRKKPAGTWSLHRRADEDGLFIEYNDVLVDRAWDGARTAILAAVWRLNGIEELTLAGAIPTLAVAAESIACAIERRVRECPFIDLSVCGSGLDGYLAALSRNTRQQIRRAMKLASAAGPLAISRADSGPDAIAALAELRALHQFYWQGRGQPGAFAAADFDGFTQALIHQPGVELLRITAGETLIGVLLNLVHRGHVYAYQSGFAYTADNRFKPGLVCHALVIADAAFCGRSAYHFMAGEGRYKESLATATESLVWLTLRRRGVRASLVQALRGVRGMAGGILHSFSDGRFSSRRFFK